MFTSHLIKSSESSTSFSILASILFVSTKRDFSTAMHVYNHSAKESFLKGSCIDDYIDAPTLSRSTAETQVLGGWSTLARCYRRGLVGDLHSALIPPNHSTPQSPWGVVLPMSQVPSCQRADLRNEKATTSPQHPGNNFLLRTERREREVRQTPPFAAV